MKQIGMIAQAFVILMTLTFIYAFVVLAIWNWNVVPNFDISPIKYTQSMVIAFILMAIEDFWFSLRIMKESLEHQKSSLEYHIMYFILKFAVVPITLIIASGILFYITSWLS